MEINPGHIQVSNQAEEENFSFGKLVSDWLTGVRVALRSWKIIAVIVLMGALIGLGYALTRKPTYTARLSFVVEEGKSSAAGVASALAGQFGLDIGSSFGGGGGGILSGDNVLQLLKSYSFVKSTLVTPYGDSTAKISLADQYAKAYELKEAWENNSKIGRTVSFPIGQKQFTRLEDSLLQTIMKRIVETELNIGKPDKKLGFFELSVTTRDELFSQLFCERLLKIATDFYVDTKTKRLSANVARLQRRADSLEGLVNRKTYSSAEAERLLLDANPAYASPSANAEISSRNKFLQTTIYAEIIKNLEISKTALGQETPTVQIVDHPEMPLKKNKTSKLFSMLAGMLVGLTISLFYFAQANRKKQENLK